MPDSQGHVYGEFESAKFDHRREDFYRYVEALKKRDLSADELLYNFTTFVGHMSLHRTLTLYEFYKQSQPIAGHIADVGVYKGASAFLFAKLIQIYESESLTLCHGFDWFQGQVVGEKDSPLTSDGGYRSDRDDVVSLASEQQLAHILKIHDLDLRTDLPEFFQRHPHIRFRLVNMDCGKYDVVKASLPLFWSRLNKGGVMIFDQYSHEHAPGETIAAHECLPPDVVLRSLPNSWMPTAYVVK